MENSRIYLFIDLLFIVAFGLFCMSFFWSCCSLSSDVKQTSIVWSGISFAFFFWCSGRCGVMSDLWSVLCLYLLFSSLSPVMLFYVCTHTCERSGAVENRKDFWDISAVFSLCRVLHIRCLNKITSSDHSREGNKCLYKANTYIWNIKERER